MPRGFCCMIHVAWYMLHDTAQQDGKPDVTHMLVVDSMLVAGARSMLLLSSSLKNICCWCRYFQPFPSAMTPRVVTLWYRAPEILLGAEVSVPDPKKDEALGICRVGQICIYTPYMTVYLVIFLPKIPYMQRIYMVLASPRDTCCCQLWSAVRAVVCEGVLLASFHGRYAILSNLIAWREMHIHAYSHETHRRTNTHHTHPNGLTGVWRGCRYVECGLRVWWAVRPYSRHLVVLNYTIPWLLLYGG